MFEKLRSWFAKVAEGTGRVVNPAPVDDGALQRDRLDLALALMRTDDWFVRARTQARKELSEAGTGKTSTSDAEVLRRVGFNLALDSHLVASGFREALDALDATPVAGPERKA